MPKQCICKGCNNNSSITEYSPYMNDYCDECTLERHDAPTYYDDTTLWHNNPPQQ